MKEVFISYKAEEIEEASWVKSVLESNGISCWMAPSCIPGGSSYAMEIPNAIRSAKVFVLILSSRAQSSQWVSREVDLAINEGKVVLPFMLENCKLKDDFNFYLTNVQRYTAYENKVAAAEKMVNEIKALLSSGNKEHTPVKRIEHTGRGSEARAEIKTEPEAKAQPEAKSGSEFKAQSQVKSSNEQTQKAHISTAKYDIISILSMALGSASVFFLLGAFVILDIAALVLSIIGVSNIKKKKLKGMGFAITGQILGIITTLFGFAFFFLDAGLIIGAIISIVSLILFIIQCVKKRSN